MDPVRSLGPDQGLPRAGGGDRERLREAARALEALVLKQLVTASKAFTGGDGAGSSIRADLFADALADAMVKGGGIGLAKQLERSLSPNATATATSTLGGGQAPALRSLVDVGDPATPNPTPNPNPTPTPTTNPNPTTNGNPTPTTTTTLPRMTSHFGMRHDPFDGHLTRHDGVDLAGEEGAEIRAAAGGIVVRAGALGGYGNAVEIDHGGGLTTLYAHASELLVRDGERVALGQAIGKVGQSGRATGPHLHFEVRRGGRPIDPSSMLPSPPSRAAPRALKIYALRAEELIGNGS